MDSRHKWFESSTYILGSIEPSSISILCPSFTSLHSFHFTLVSSTTVLCPWEVPVQRFTSYIVCLVYCLTNTTLAVLPFSSSSQIGVISDFNFAQTSIICPSHSLPSYLEITPHYLVVELGEGFEVKTPAKTAVIYMLILV